MIPCKHLKEEELKCKQLRVVLNRISDDVFRKCLSDSTNSNHSTVQYSGVPSVQKEHVDNSQDELFRKENLNECPTGDFDFASESTSTATCYEYSSQEYVNSQIDLGVSLSSIETHIKAKTNCSVSEKSHNGHQMKKQKGTFSNQAITEKERHTLKKQKGSLKTQGTKLKCRKLVKSRSIQPKHTNQVPALKDLQIVCERLPYDVYQIYSKHISVQNVLDRKNITRKSEKFQCPVISANCDKKQSDNPAKKCNGADLVNKVNHKKNLKSNVKVQSKTSHSHLNKGLSNKKTDFTGCTKKTKTKYSNKLCKLVNPLRKKPKLAESKDLKSVDVKHVLNNQGSDQMIPAPKNKKVSNALSPSVKTSKVQLKKLKEISSENISIDNNLQNRTNISLSLIKNVKSESITKRCKYCRKRARNKLVNKMKYEKQIKVPNITLSTQETISDLENIIANESDLSVESGLYSQNIEDIERSHMFSTDKSKYFSNEKRNCKDLKQKCKCHLSKSQLKVKRKGKLMLKKQVGTVKKKKCANKTSSRMLHTETAVVGVKASMNLTKKSRSKFLINNSEHEHIYNNCSSVYTVGEKSQDNCIAKIKNKENITALNEVALINNISLENMPLKTIISSVKALPFSQKLKTGKVKNGSKNCVKNSEGNTFKGKEREIVKQGYKCVKLFEKFSKLNHNKKKKNQCSQKTADKNILEIENTANPGKSCLSLVPKQFNFGEENEIPLIDISSENMSSETVISPVNALSGIQNLKTGKIKNFSKNCIQKTKGNILKGKKMEIIDKGHNCVELVENFSKLNHIKNKEHQSMETTSNKSISEPEDAIDSQKNCLPLPSQNVKLGKTNSSDKVVRKGKKSLHCDYSLKESKITKQLKRKLENQMKKLERKVLLKKFVKKGTNSKSFQKLENMTAIQFISLLSQHKQLALYFTNMLNESFMIKNSNSGAKLVLHHSNVQGQNTSVNKPMEDVSDCHNNPSLSCKTLRVVLSRLSDSDINFHNNTTLANITSCKGTEYLKNGDETGTPVKSVLKNNNHCKSPVPRKVTFNLDVEENEGSYHSSSRTECINTDDGITQATDSSNLKIDSFGLKHAKVVLKRNNIDTNLYSVEKSNSASFAKVNSPVTTELNNTDISKIRKMPFHLGREDDWNTINELQDHISQVSSKEPLKSFNESDLSSGIVLPYTNSDQNVIELFDSSSSSDQVEEVDAIEACLNEVLATCSISQKENVANNKKKKGTTQSKIVLKKRTSLKYQLGFLHHTKKFRIQHALRLRQRGVSFERKLKKCDEDLSVNNVMNDTA